MSLRRAVASVLGALAVFAGLSGEADASEVLKVGTLAPRVSPWGKVFEVWEKAVAQKSGGKLTLQFFYNGQQGDEGAMVGKMKAGQLDGAAVTAVGLSKIYKPILALQIPGVNTTWAKLDAARDALKGDFEKGITSAGFQLVGWGDVGQAHIMSSGPDGIRTPKDLIGKKPYMWREDIVAPVFFQVVGATPVPLNVPEVLPNLNSGAINVLNVPALAAEQLQWAPKLNNIHEDVTGCAIGALVFSSKRVEALPPDLKAILFDTGTVAGRALTQRIRGEDAAAFGRMKGRMTVITLKGDEKQAWTDTFKEVRKRLGQGTFEPALISRLEKMAGL